MIKSSLLLFDRQQNVIEYRDDCNTSKEIFISYRCFVLTTDAKGLVLLFLEERETMNI